MLIDTLQAANINALKSHDKEARAILSVVINKYRLAAIELRSAGTDITDADLVSIIMKSLKELKEEMDSYIKVNNVERGKAIKKQMETIEQYLPKMLSEEDIQAEILTLEDRSIPSIMKHFKSKFAGQVDMGVVNKVARSIK